MNPYRDELEAAHQRIAALEAELQSLSALQSNTIPVPGKIPRCRAFEFSLGFVSLLIGAVIIQVLRAVLG